MLYRLNTEKKSYTKAKKVSLKDIGWLEKDLENLLSTHIRDFVYSNDLMTIFTETPGQEAPDILALDRNGDLYIFELKAWGSQQENLLQVLRYGQLFGGSDYDALNELYQKYANTTANLYDAHRHYFDLDSTSPLSQEHFNRQQHFVLVTNGLDQKTVEAIRYWQQNRLNIDAIIYWVFEISGEYYIEFNMYSPIDGFLEYEAASYVLNTDYTSSKKHHADMINEKKAAAYSSGYREKIERIQKGDTVFLYKSGEGIIAYGTASGKIKKYDTDEETSMPLENFKILKRAMSASDMKRITGQGFPFMQTLYAVNTENCEKIIREIEKNYL